MNEVQITNAVRCLCADIVQKANSGHPGMPLGMAPAACVLFSEFLNFDSSDPKWINRDRFIVSNGHGSALLYSMLHLTGYSLDMSDLQKFRQIHSKTPGHPERHPEGHPEYTPGVEVTTGPLGQGITNAVGIAIVQKHLAARFNKPNFPIVDHHIYVFCGDGCLMEGISYEAMSLAGHLKLNNIIVIYDDNHITIDGRTSLAFTEDVPKRAQALGWFTYTVENGNEDFNAIREAIKVCKEQDRPSIISLKTIIGFGAFNQDTYKVHGSPLGAEGVAKLKTAFGRDPAKSFYVEEEVYEHFRKSAYNGRRKHEAWNEVLTRYESEYPAESAEFTKVLHGETPSVEELLKLAPAFSVGKDVSTRQASETVLNALAPTVYFMGGSADLAPSVLTLLKCSKDFQAGEYDGRYLRFGVREHAMAAIGNGMAAYHEGAVIPYVATFLNFVGYASGAVRLASLSRLGVVWIATHDSIGLGEDGPTHTPIEVPLTLRATPNSIVLRPADANETIGAYIVAIKRRKTPTFLCLSRQGLPVLEHTNAEATLKGAYVVHEASSGNAELVVVATGSEVSAVITAVNNAGLANVRVVSMPSWELFEEQSKEYKASIFPDLPTVSVEAWTTVGWDRYSHFQFGITNFTHSAPAGDIQENVGLSASRLAERLKKVLNHVKGKNYISRLAERANEF